MRRILIRLTKEQKAALGVNFDSKDLDASLNLSTSTSGSHSASGSVDAQFGGGFQSRRRRQVNVEDLGISRSVRTSGTAIRTSSGPTWRSTATPTRGPRHISGT